MVRAKTCKVPSAQGARRVLGALNQQIGGVGGCASSSHGGTSLTTFSTTQ